MRERLHLLATALILACALVWRLPATDGEWQFTLCENDSLYQLHRIETCLSRFPSVESIDAYSHYPQGYRVHWIALHTVFYAAVARIAGVAPEQRDTLIALLSWFPPLFGVAAVLLALVIARGVTGTRWGMYATGVFCAFSADVCRPFFFGTIDHHLFAHLGILLMVWGRLRRRATLWLAGLVALLAMTPEAILYVSALLGCLFVSELAAPAAADDREWRARWFWFLSPSAVCLLVWFAQQHVETAPLPLRELNWMYLTLFQPAWFAVVGVGMAATLLGTDHFRRRPRTGGAIALSSGLALAVVALSCVGFIWWVGALPAIVERLLVSHRIFVGEEASVFRGGFWQAPAWYRILAFSGVFVVAKLLAGLRNEMDSTHWFHWLVLAVALALGFKEFRHLYVVSSLQLIGLAAAVCGTERLLRRLPLFSGRLTRILPGAVLALATVPFLVTDDIVNRAAIHGDACARLSVTRELTDWLRKHTPEPAAIAGGVPAYGVMSPWSIGHHIRIMGKRPVIVDPFNYEIGHGVGEALEQFWQAKTADNLVETLDRYRARYLVLTNVGEEIVGTLRRSGARRDDFVLIAPGRAPIFLPAMNQFASFRLFMSSGLSGEFGAVQPRFFTADSEIFTVGSGTWSDSYRLIIPKGQIYEVKPGATLMGNAPYGTDDVRVGFTLRRNEEQPAQVSLSLALDAERRFRFHTALPAPHRESSFQVESGYTFTAGDHAAAVVDVTQEMVDTRATVPVPWPAEPAP